MVNGKVDDLSWSQLRPRRTVSPFIVDAIPSHDLQSFLRLMAINPFVSFNQQSPVVRKIINFRQWRAETTMPISKRIPGAQRPTPQRSAKRPRDTSSASRSEVSYRVDADEEDEGEETDMDWDGSQPKRKHRRSARPSLATERRDILDDRDAPSGSLVEIGEDRQASIPKQRGKDYWMANAVTIESKRMFSSGMCGGDKKVEAYLHSVNTHLRRRDGFELAPFALQVALDCFAAAKGHADAALKACIRKLPRGTYFPGIKGPFLYEEQCKFVRTLAEREKNFLYISRYVLPKRSVSELVWLYYARHKQLWLQNGGYKNGQVLDDGGDKLKKVSLTTLRAIGALRSLAITAGDGFPIDGRAQQAITAVRRGMVVEEKEKKEEEYFSKSARGRNGV